MFQKNSASCSERPANSKYQETLDKARSLLDEMEPFTISLWNNKQFY